MEKIPNQCENVKEFTNSTKKFEKLKKGLNEKKRTYKVVKENLSK